MELSRRLKARGSTVTAYCVSPGRVSTNIFENVPGLLRPPLKVLAGLFFQTPKQVRNSTPNEPTGIIELFSLYKASVPAQHGQVL